MAEEGLKIRIGADLGPANAAVRGFGDTVATTGQQAENAFNGIAGAAQRLPDALAPVGAAVRGVAQAVQPLRTGITEPIGAAARSFTALGAAAAGSNRGIAGAGAALRSAVPGANAAGFALTNVGRVAQDLPFGFIGIQNNLNPLLESFQRLKAETGSTGGALKALGSSLLGAGGIGLALSLVSGAILIFQNGIAGFNRKSKEAKESADELSKSIKAIGDITGEATAGVQGQIQQVQVLAKAVGDSNAPYDQRKRALQELKEINKAYFGDLKLEDAITGKLTSTVNEYSKALVNSAIQKAFVDEIAQVAKASVKADADIQKAKDGLARVRGEEIKSQQAILKVQQQVIGSAGTAAGISSTQIGAEQKIAQAKNKTADAQKALSLANETGTKLQEQRLQLEDQLNRAVIEGLKFKDLTTSADKKGEDALKKRIEALKKLQTEVGLTQPQQVELLQLEVQLARRDGVKLGFTKKEIEDQVEALITKTFAEQGKEFVAANQTIRVGGVIDFSKTKIDKPKFDKIDIAGAFGITEIPPDAFDGVVRSLKEGAARTKEAGKEIELNLGDIAGGIQDAIIGAFDSLGTAIGEAFAGGGFGGILGKFGESLLKIVGGVLQDIGKQIVVASTLVQTLKKVLASVGLGAASLVVGLGLIVLGGALKSIKFNTPQFEKGGIATGPKSGYLATLHGTELIIPMNKIDKSPSRGGLQGSAGIGQVILQPSIAISGQALRVLLNRVDRSNSRLT